MKNPIWDLCGAVVIATVWVAGMIYITTVAIFDKDE